MPFKKNISEETIVNYIFEGEYRGKYEGDFIFGKRNGYGVMFYPDGCIYKGEWKNDKCHGYGELTNDKDKTIFKGIWKNDIMDGPITAIFPNGDVVEAIWKDSKIIDGKGKVIRGKNVYIGEIKDGKPRGEGMMTFSSGDIYEGDWLDDKCHGIGKMTYANGNIYEGEWINGEKNGNGRMTYADGDIYEGRWQDGELNGHVKMWYSNGDAYEGTWKYGEVVGKKWKFLGNINEPHD